MKNENYLLPNRDSETEAVDVNDLCKFKCTMLNALCNRLMTANDTEKLALLCLIYYVT
jgi:hypothetical protein